MLIDTRPWLWMCTYLSVGTLVQLEYTLNSVKPKIMLHAQVGLWVGVCLRARRCAGVWWFLSVPIQHMRASILTICFESRTHTHRVTVCVCLCVCFYAEDDFSFS